MEQSLKRLINKIKKYAPNSDFKLLEKAYNLSQKAHREQMRESGEPFITHPMGVAYILAELELDCTSIIAGILHDTIEDTTFTMKELKQEFGEEIANLINGVTKLGKIPYSTKEEQQVENLRKMFLAMAKDIRVILIKLADRLHNMRTLKYLSEDKQKEKARETLEIYAPLAHRLGISKMKWELEDLSLRHYDPKGYYDLRKKISKRRKEREKYINEIVETVTKRIKDIGIKDAYIEGRPKHFYSIYRKMIEQNKSIEQIYDLFALRVIVNSVKDCYAVLGLIHEIYKPIPGRFKDYIAVPKPNMYQSLHSTMVGHEGIPFEIQIRTWDMHRIAEVGIAAHWKYKEGSAASSDTESKLAWLRQLLDWQTDMRDAKEFMENLKIELFSDEVFVFTPRGDVISLPSGSTPIDFAYVIHSDIGNQMTGAKINGRIVSIDYQLNNGDIVEILTSSSSHGPSRDWLKIVKSSQAKNKIKQWFKREKRDENIVRGKELIEKELKRQGIAFNQLFKPEWLDIILKKYTFNTLDDLYAGIGYGAITANKIISRLKEELRKNLKQEEAEEILHEQITQTKVSKKKSASPESGVVVKDIDNCLVRLAKCCNPVPGDEIVGYITRGRGVSVHRNDCQNVQGMADLNERLIEVKWYKSVNVSYNAEITIFANDRTALLMEVTNVIVDEKIKINAVNARTTKDQIAVMNITMKISNTEQLDRIIKKIKKLDSIIDVTRNKN